MKMNKNKDHINEASYLLSKDRIILFDTYLKKNEKKKTLKFLC